MKVIFTINGVKEERDIPTSWEQVTYSQYLEVLKSKDDFSEHVRIFTGIDLSGCRVKGLNKIISALSFLGKTPKMSVPKSILGYAIPDNLEFDELSRYIAMEEILKTFTEDTEQNAKRYPEMVAIYAAPAPYDDKAKSDRLIDYFHGAPALEVLAVGNFTIQNILGLKNIIPTTPLGAASLLTRLKRAMTNFSAFLARIPPFYFLRKSHHISVTKF